MSPLFIGDARKRKQQMAVRCPYDYMVMGHWHTYLKARGVIVNGSLKGRVSVELRFRSADASGLAQPPGTRNYLPLADLLKSRRGTRTRRVANASLRMSRQTAGVSSLSGLFSPCNNFVSSCASALRFSSGSAQLSRSAFIFSTATSVCDITAIRIIRYSQRSSFPVGLKSTTLCTFSSVISPRKSDSLYFDGSFGLPNASSNETTLPARTSASPARIASISSASDRVSAFRPSSRIQRSSDPPRNLAVLSHVGRSWSTALTPVRLDASWLRVC